MAIQNLTEEAREVLDKLSPKEKEIIWGLVSSPPSQRARAACRRELTAYLVSRLEPYSYIARIVMYRDLLNLLILEGNVSEDNHQKDVLGEVAWLNCHENDRPFAVMMALKKLNATMSFKVTETEADKDIDFNLNPMDYETAVEPDDEPDTPFPGEEDEPEFAETEYVDDLEDDIPPDEFFDELNPEVEEEDHIPL